MEGPRKDIVYSVDVKTYPDGILNILFSCDGGKFGTMEAVDEYELTILELLKILQQHYKSNHDEYEYCDCSQAKGADLDVNGFPYCIECQKYFAPN